MNQIEKLLAENEAKIQASGRVKADSTDGSQENCLCCEYRNPHRHPWSRMLNKWLFHCEMHDIVIDEDGWCPCFKSMFDKYSSADANIGKFGCLLELLFYIGVTLTLGILMFSL